MERLTEVERARQYIEEHPGCSGHEVAAHLGVLPAAVRKMLHRDIQKCNVDTDVIDNVTHYWLQGRSKVRAKVGHIDVEIEALLRGRSLTCSQIMYGTGKARSHVWTALQRMEQRGRIRSTSHTLPIRWYLLPDSVYEARQLAPRGELEEAIRACLADGQPRKCADISRAVSRTDPQVNAVLRRMRVNGDVVVHQGRPLVWALAPGR